MSFYVLHTKCVIPHSILEDETRELFKSYKMFTLFLHLWNMFYLYEWKYLRHKLIVSITHLPRVSSFIYFYLFETLVFSLFHSFAATYHSNYTTDYLHHHIHHNLPNPSTPTSTDTLTENIRRHKQTTGKPYKPFKHISAK